MGMYVGQPAAGWPASGGPAPAPGTRRAGLGLEIEPKTALLGIGALMLAFYILGGRAEPKRRARKKARREKKIGALRQQIKQLETGRIEEFEGD